MQVLFPTSLNEACAMMAQERDDRGAPAVPIAGGTDLLVHWPIKPRAQERLFLDLSALAEIRAIRWTQEFLELGALTTFWDVIGDARIAVEFPVLVAAARTVGAIQIQARGTWAGNIMNASPAADGVPALMSCDAVVVLADSRGRSEVPLCEFYSGYKQRAARPDQLIAAIKVPRTPCDFAAFEKVGSRRAQAITKVGAAITHQVGDPRTGWRIAVNSVGPTVRRCRELERALARGSAIRSPAELLTHLKSDISPIDDIRSTARYRAEVLARVLYHRLRGGCPTVT